MFISGPGGDAAWVGPAPDPATAWKVITVPIDEAAWTVNTGSWSAILFDVTEVSIAMEYYNNAGTHEITGIDNISLSSVPEPSAMALLVSGVVGIGLFADKRRKQFVV